MMNDLLQGLNVYLIGLMGVGKTTVGQHLARELSYRFVDTDVLIEKIAGKTISQIFADSGEEEFRQLESSVLSEVSAYTKLVVATGGGIVLKQMNWSYLQQGLIIWLDAPVAVLIERLQDDTTRPLLKTPDPEATLQSLLNQRRHLYTEADIYISINASDTPSEITSRIIAAIPSVIQSK